jgi:hypothetical protein
MRLTGKEADDVSSDVKAIARPSNTRVLRQCCSMATADVVGVAEAVVAVGLGLPAGEGTVGVVVDAGPAVPPQPAINDVSRTPTSRLFTTVPTGRGMNW